jgi:bifunctional DNA-binding transcriptional regulator/antitoxin component of YhaV-PrlF toxin-antitoxin module
MSLALAGVKDHLTIMSDSTTITLSSKGQFALPKKLRHEDNLSKSDVFRLERLGSGKYLLEKMSPPQLPKARLVKSKDGFLVFRAPPGAPRITSDLVKKLEAETI